MMKKNVLLLLVLASFSLAATAQIKKGSLFLGGDIGGSTRTAKTDGTSLGKENSLRISPVFGKAVRENLFVGIDGTLSLYKNEISNSPNDYKQQQYGGGVFIRKYKPLGKSDFFLFLQCRLGYQYQKLVSINNPPTAFSTKTNTVSLSAYPGISYAVSKKLHIETGFNGLVNLSYYNETNNQGNSGSGIVKSNGVSLHSSLENLSSIYIGFRLLLAK